MAAAHRLDRQAGRKGPDELADDRARDRPGSGLTVAEPRTISGGVPDNGRCWWRFVAASQVTAARARRPQVVSTTSSSGRSRAGRGWPRPGGAGRDGPDRGRPAGRRLHLARCRQPACRAEPYRAVLDAGLNMVPPAFCILGIGVLVHAAYGHACHVVDATACSPGRSSSNWSVGSSDSNHWLLDTSVFHQMAAAPASSPELDQRGCAGRHRGGSWRARWIRVRAP